MRTINEPTEAPLDLSQPKPEQPAKPDTFTEVSKDIVRNNRTGRVETRIKPPPPVWQSVDEQCED